MPCRDALLCVSPYGTKFHLITPTVETPYMASLFSSTATVNQLENCFTVNRLGPSLEYKHKSRLYSLLLCLYYAKEQINCHNRFTSPNYQGSARSQIKKVSKSPHHCDNGGNNRAQ